MRLDLLKESLRDLVDSYELSPNLILGTVESVLGEVLTRRLRDDKVTVNIDPDSMTFHIVGWTYSGTFRAREIPEDSLTGIKNLHKNVTWALQARSVYRKAIHYTRRYRDAVRKGQIIKVDREGGWIVELNLAPGEAPVVSYCARQHQMPGERGLAMVGDVKLFHLRSYRPQLDRDVPRLEIRIDRTSKQIPQQILRQKILRTEESGKVKVTVKRRVVGSLVEVWSTVPISRELCLEIKKELGEKVFVVVARNGVEARKEKKLLRTNRATLSNPTRRTSRLNGPAQ